MLSAARVSLVTILALVTPLVAAPASGQYFGRNAVQHKRFQFEVFTTEHFHVYFYPEAREAAEDMARMAERWYTRLSDILDHDLSSPQPLIVYASAPDFRQTNVVPGITEGTGGVTEGYKRRIVMPAFGTLAETDHVLGHELVHAFQYDIARGAPDGGGFGSALERLPLWFIEGMAEYLSIGHVDAHTAMWIRDAARGEDGLPAIRALDHHRYFPYRWGQAFWAYVAGRWGDRVIRPLLDEAIATGSPRAAIREVLGLSDQELSEQWHQAIVSLHAAVLEAGARASSSGRALSAEAKPSGLAVAPALSPDGRRLVYLSERDRLSVDMYLADAETGRIIRRLTNTAIDPHFSSIQFLASAGAWHPNGRELAFGAIRQGLPVLAILDTETGRRVREIPFPSLGEILNPAWSPDGRSIAFSATAAGRADLFVYDLTTDEVRRLTDDAFAALQPAWSPDGRRLAFVTDRFSTDLATLHAGRLELALLEVSSGRIEALPAFGRGKAINPQWAPGGRELYFLADATGVTNIHAIDVESGRLRQITNLDAGVTGITALSPALSVPVDARRLAFTAYEEGRIGIYLIEGLDALSGVPIDARSLEGTPVAAMLPPETRAGDLVLSYLEDGATGLPAGLDESEPYRARLGLDTVGQPYVSAGYSQFGGMYGGGIALQFSDMLGNHNVYAAIDTNTYGGSARDLYRNIGGIVAYTNLTRRWNWGVSGGQAPYVTSYYTAAGPTPTGFFEQEVIGLQTYRGVDGRIAYPFSTARRIELGAGFQQVSFEEQVRTSSYARTGQLLGQASERRSIADSLQFGTATAALVYDTSVFGATSPISGRRSRVEVTPAFGSLGFTSALADYRHYLMPVSFYTIAARALHYGRYGGGAESSPLSPLYLGYPELVRGYAIGSFRASECAAGPAGGACETFDRLVGSRLLVGNLELRFPLLRPFGVRSGMYGPLPVEVAVFADGGVAWTQSQAPSFFGGDRRPASSAGVSLRVNLFGLTVAQTDLAYPFQRGGRGWVWSIALTPGF